ncbi:hypothetical protein [Ralstonia phage RP13]|nr:hypothetical protein [Ralstonia phage RP13]BCG50290.1 hypothetical protein [Ralstonia phage RP13]
MRDMYTIADHIAIERKLAELLGWFDITQITGSLIGSHKDLRLDTRGQAAIPQWTRRWSDCGPLMVKYRISPTYGKNEYGKYVWIFNELRCIGEVCLNDHYDEDLAVMLAVITAVINTIEALKND